MKRRSWFVTTIVACLIFLALGWVTERPPSRPLSDLLETYPARPFSVTEGLSFRPHRSWIKQRVRSYASDLSVGDLQTRFRRDLRRYGMTQVLGSFEPIEWRNTEGSLRVKIFSPRNSRLFSNPPAAKWYIQIWEPRRTSVPERLNDLWYDLSFPFRPNHRVRVFKTSPRRTIPKGPAAPSPSSILNVPLTVREVSSPRI